MTKEEKARIDAIMSIAAKLEDIAAALRILRLQLTEEALKQTQAGLAEPEETKGIH